VHDPCAVFVAHEFRSEIRNRRYFSKDTFNTTDDILYSLVAGLDDAGRAQLREIGMLEAESIAKPASVDRPSHTSVDRPKPHGVGRPIFGLSAALRA
jgi:hypothetical protein